MDVTRRTRQKPYTTDGRNLLRSMVEPVTTQRLTEWVMGYSQAHKNGRYNRRVGFRMRQPALSSIWSRGAVVRAQSSGLTILSDEYHLCNDPGGCPCWFTFFVRLKALHRNRRILTSENQVRLLVQQWPLGA